MSLIRGLFVRKDSARGTTPVEARKALAGLLTPSGAFGARPGVLSGFTVTGSAGWAYSIGSGHIATSRGASDGIVLAANDGAAPVPTDPAPGTGGRIDLVWVKHSDVDSGDPTSGNDFGVTRGVVSGSPVVPALPAGATELARATVMAGATSTSHPNVTITNTFQRTGLRGAIIDVPDATARLALGNPPAGAGYYAHEASTGITWKNAGSGWSILDAPSRTYTVAWTSNGTNPTLGNGNLIGRYTISGGIVMFSIELTVGSTTALGTGAYYILSLPVPASGQIMANATATDQGSRTYTGNAHIITASLMRVVFETGAGAPPYWSPTGPFVMASTDKLLFAGTYEAS